MKRWVLFFCFPFFVYGTIKAGVGRADLTPPEGTPSAGYAERKGQPMQGVHDPLLAVALLLQNDEKTVVFCSVDHLGFTYEMAAEVIRRAQGFPELKESDIFIGSSHTHSGGGAFLNFPIIGSLLAGAYDPKQVEFYIEKTVQAILRASHHRMDAKVGIGYGIADKLSTYRSGWPQKTAPLQDVAVIKVETVDGSPLAVLFNYPVHPTVLGHKNLFFSSDFVGYARDHIRFLLGDRIEPIYFNGAQGDIAPNLSKGRSFASCNQIGESLAYTVERIWRSTPTLPNLDIASKKIGYEFTPEATPSGLLLPIPHYQTEINLIVLNKTHAFVTIPGELSSIYDARFKQVGRDLGYTHLSVFGLTNDAHGYIILPEAWRQNTFESRLSFGGELYGDRTEERVVSLLKELMP